MIENVGNRITYSGNGVATEFAYSFKIINKSDINVLLTDADGVETLLTKDYYVDTDKSIVTYPGYAEGAEIVADEQPPVLPEGWKLTIYRAVPITQETDLPDNYPFNNVEDIGDKLTMICQQLADGVNRSLKTSISDNSDLDITVPWQAGKSFRISDDGTKLELTDDPARVTPQVQSLLSQTQVQAQIATTNATAAANSALDANIYAADAKSYMETAKDYSENVNVFIPSVSSDGVISWTNKAGLENPASVSVKGEKGDKGDAGAAATVTIGNVTTGEAGTDASVTNVGTTTAAKFNFVLPKGDKGDAGAAATITIGTVTKGDTASVTNVGTTTAAKFNFVLPKGDKGDKGDTGAQGEQGEQGAKGDTGPQGATGAAGAAATVTIGNVTTGEAGTDASVTNSGTTSAAVLNFIIPRGANGADGGIEVDTALSSTSTNPVQNKIINAALNAKADTDDILVTVGDYTAITGRENLVVIDPDGEDAYISEVDIVKSYADKAAESASSAKGYNDNITTTISTVTSKVDSAVSTANTANSNSTAALSTATTAQSTAESAQTTASSAETKAESALAKVDTQVLVDMFYPVGSVYMTTSDTLPAFMSYGTWEEIASDRVLQGASSSHKAGSTVAAGLPNITGTVGQAYDGTSVNGGWHNYNDCGGGGTGALYLSGTSSGSSCLLWSYSDAGLIAFDASKSNSIYGASTTVQPPAYIVHIYKRTA